MRPRGAHVREDRSVANPSAEALELLYGHTELAEDLVEEGRSDLSANMEGNRHGTAIKDDSNARGCPSGAVSRNRADSPPAGGPARWR